MKVGLQCETPQLRNWGAGLLISRQNLGRGEGEGPISKNIDQAGVQKNEEVEGYSGLKNQNTVLGVMYTYRGTPFLVQV